MATEVELHEIEDDWMDWLQQRTLIPAHPNCRCAFVPADDRRFARDFNPYHRGPGPGGGQFTYAPEMGGGSGGGAPQVKVLGMSSPDSAIARLESLAKNNYVVMAAQQTFGVAEVALSNGTLRAVAVKAQANSRGARRGSQLRIGFSYNEKSLTHAQARELMEKEFREARFARDYNPNQPRDPKGTQTGGRWTKAGATGGLPKAPEKPLSEMTEEEIRAHTVEQTSREIAEQLGYDPDLIDMRYDEYPFEVNGQKYKAAGLAHLETGRIEMFPNQIPQGGTPAVISHEVMHQKFERVLNAYHADRDLMMKDPGPPPNPLAELRWERLGGTDALMKPDGSLRPPYDKKYPIYSRYQNHFEANYEKLRKDDGITNYSRAYWAEYHTPGGKVSSKSAMHETLAEIASRHYTTGVIEGTPVWRSLYRDVNKTYRDLQKVKK